jgi:hypothetical protein
MREIVCGDRRYLLAVRTPCSADFAVEAKSAADTVGLPLRWVEATLDHLERALSDAIERKLRETHG